MTFEEHLQQVPDTVRFSEQWEVVATREHASEVFALGSGPEPVAASAVPQLKKTGKREPLPDGERFVVQFAVRKSEHELVGGVFASNRLIGDRVLSLVQKDEVVHVQVTDRKRGQITVVKDGGLKL